MKKKITATAAATALLLTLSVGPAHAGEKYNGRWICNYFPVFCNG